MEIKSIESDGRFGWQDSIIHILEDFKKYGLIFFMSRTGTGKGSIACLNLISDSKKYKETIQFVPNNQKCLIKQHVKTLEKYCKKKNIPCEKSSDSDSDSDSYQLTIDNEKYNFTIKPFPNSSKSITSVLKYENCALYLDEPHMYQTAFGLSRAKNNKCHSITKITSLLNAVKKENDDNNDLFENIIPLANSNKVVFVSATLDDIIIKEIGPYIGSINKILAIIVNHKKEDFPEINITQIEKEDEINNKIKEKYLAKEKTFIYCAKVEDMEKIKRNLVDIYNILPDDVYSWNSKSREKQLDATKVQEKLISIFINGGTTGLDIKNLKNVFILRKLSSSSSSCRGDNYEDNFSNTAQQIMGRIREDGNVYRLKYSKNEISDNLFDYTEQAYKNVLSSKTKFIHQVESRINTKKLSQNFKNYYIRPFIQSYITTEDYHKNESLTIEKKPTVLNNFKKFNKECSILHKFWNSLLEKFKEENSFFNIELNEWIKKYLDLEPKMIEEYEMVVKNYDTKFNVLFCKKKIAHGNRTTGGGSSKYNINKKWQKFGQDALQKAILLAGFDGKSLIFIKDDESDKYGGEFMHSKPKRDLSPEEIVKSKFAFPMTENPTEVGINQNENIDDPNFPWDEENECITVNYELLLKNVGKFGRPYLRKEEAVKKILYFYNYFQKNETLQYNLNN